MTHMPTTPGIRHVNLTSSHATSFDPDGPDSIEIRAAWKRRKTITSDHDTGVKLRGRQAKYELLSKDTRG